MVFIILRGPDFSSYMMKAKARSLRKSKMLTSVQSGTVQQTNKIRKENEIDESRRKRKEAHARD